MLFAISEGLDLWLEKGSEIGNSFACEREFITTSRRINHILFSKSLGDITCDKNKKDFISV